MRILRLIADGEFAVEFHPYITVVRSATDDQRRAIIEAFAAASSGRVTVSEGLIEAHGMVLDLDEESLALLDLPGSPPEQTVQAGDLPGSAGEIVGRQVRAVERRLESLEQPTRDSADALRRAEERLEAALAEQGAAETALVAFDVPATDEDPDAGDGQGEHAREQASADAAVQARAAELERRRGELDARDRELRQARAVLLASLMPDAVEVRDAAAAARDAARAAVVGEPAAPDGAPPSVVDPDERRASLEARRTLLRQDEPDAVRASLDELRLMHRPGEMAQSPRALSLADRVETLEREVAGHDVGDEPSTAEVEAAEARAEEARQALAEAERTAEPASVDVEALEAAHAEVEAAREAAEGKLRRAKHEERLEEAKQAEEEILERLGLASYTEYLMAGGLVASDDADGADTMALRLAALEADAEAADLRRAVDEALGVAERVDELRRARNEARDLLGDPDLSDERVVTALLNFREPADATAPVDGLARALEDVGLPVAGLDLPVAELESLAVDWLANHEAAMVEIETELASLRDPVSEPAVEPDDLALSEQASAEVPASLVERAETDLAAAEERVTAHERAVAALSAVEAELVEVADRRTSMADEELAGPSLTIEVTEAEDGAQPPTRDEARSAAEAALAAATEAVELARAEVGSAAAVAAESAASYDDAVQELAALRQTHADLGDEAPPVDEIEWYLLARLAALRQISFAGSVPLVIDGALDDVADEDGLWHLLDRLERMAGAVQIVHLTDDERIAAWADALALGRGAVVAPVAPAASPSPSG